MPIAYDCASQCVWQEWMNAPLPGFEYVADEFMALVMHRVNRLGSTNQVLTLSAIFLFLGLFFRTVSGEVGGRRGSVMKRRNVEPCNLDRVPKTSVRYDSRHAAHH